jgi:hypothetical protein
VNAGRIGGARYVVTTETHDDGVGGTREITHEYDTAFVNTAGRGWQSFRSHTVTDTVQGTYSVTEYSPACPTPGIPVSIEQRTVSGDKLIRSVAATLPTPSQMELSRSTPPRQFPRVAQTTTLEYEVFGDEDGELLRTIVQTPAYDTTYGFVTDVSGANCYSLRKRKCVEPATIALPAKPFDRSPWTRRAQSAFPRRAPQEFAAGCVSAVPDLRAVSGVHDIVGGIDSLRRIFGGCCWSDSAQCGVSSLPVVVLLELEELSLEIPCAPKRDVIQELSPQRADQPLDERVR